MMDWDYELQNGRYLISMENGKKYFMEVAKVDNLQKQLKISEFEAIEMWLEDNGYLVNEEQNALDMKAKGNKVKLATNTEKPKAKTQRERTQKAQPEKEFLITSFHELLLALPGVDNIICENKAKLITFDYKGASYKLDLVQKRKSKVEK